MKMKATLSEWKANSRGVQQRCDTLFVFFIIHKKFLIKSTDRYVNKYLIQGSIPIDSKQKFDTLLLAVDQVYSY